MCLRLRNGLLHTQIRSCGHAHPPTRAEALERTPSRVYYRSSGQISYLTRLVSKCLYVCACIDEEVHLFDTHPQFSSLSLHQFSENHSLVLSKLQPHPHIKANFLIKKSILLCTLVFCPQSMTVCVAHPTLRRHRQPTIRL